MRRLGLIFALIPAILASIGLAYYSYTRSQSDRQAMLGTLTELAEEKLIGVESELGRAEEAFYTSIQFDKKHELKPLLEGSPFRSVFLLDTKMKILPGGTHSKGPVKEAREFFEQRILPKLDLEGARLNQRRHLHTTLDGVTVLYAYRRQFSESTGRIYFVVLETDLNNLIQKVFPSFFNTRSEQLYQVVDENGELVYGHPFTGIPEMAVVEVGFPQTLSRWKLRVTRRDRMVLADYETRQLIDAALIGVALVFIVGGLIVLIMAVRRERRLSQLKSDFISNVSHELKTPLSIISMFGELLATGRTKGPEQATEYAEIIRRESVRLSRLIDNVLDFAKIERGADVYEFARCDLIDVTRRAVELSRHRLERDGVEHELDLPDEPAEVSMDDNAFTLAVLNLVDNALKYASDGKKIRVTIELDDKRAILSVKDWGPGIEPEEKDQIFERFYRAKSVRLKPIRGSGIGLALVKHVVTAHGGDIEVESEPGAGTTFRLWIPLASAA